MRGPMPGHHHPVREQKTFPAGSVEATQPLLMKRRKYTKIDVQPVEGWRLVMSLRSGLLMESTWALDVINILMYDDHAFGYFGLANMPGLIEALLEHWRATLIAMFEITQELELSTRDEAAKRAKPTSIADVHARKRRKRRRKLADSDQLFAEDSEGGAGSEFEEERDDDVECRLGRVGKFDPEDKCLAPSGGPATPSKTTRHFYHAHQVWPLTQFFSCSFFVKNH